VVDQAIDDGQLHRLVREDLSPFAERLVGADQQGSPLVSGADELEQDAGFGLILSDIGEIVEDQQMPCRRRHGAAPRCIAKGARIPCVLCTRIRYSRAIGVAPQRREGQTQ
jgi:hypothetical protein